MLDLTIEEDEAADLLKEIEKQLKKRQWGEAIRLEVEQVFLRYGFENIAAGRELRHLAT